MANTKWEYNAFAQKECVNVNQLNYYGQEGWQIFSETLHENGNYSYMMKRPIMDSVLSGIMQADRRLLEAYEIWKKSHVIWCHGRSQKEAINKFLASNGA